MKLGRSIAVVAGLAMVAGLVQTTNAAIIIRASNTAFTDISTTGTLVTGAVSDDSEHTITGAQLAGFAGNQLLAGGVSIRVGNNGGVLWGTSATDTFASADNVGYYNPGPSNSTAPAGSQTSIATMLPVNGTGATANGNGLRQFLAPHWDDTTTTSGGLTNIRFQILSGNLIVQWSNEDHFAATGTGTITYQMVVYGGALITTPGQKLVEFIYNDTLFAPNQYQDDGGSATIGYKNWGLNGLANDVEFGVGGGGPSATADPAFGTATMQPKVAGWVANNGTNGPHSVEIVPEPATLSLLALGAIALIRRRR